MSAAIWTTALVIGVPLGLWLLTLIIGLLAPLNVTAPRLLKKRLKSLQVVGAVPDDCIREFANERIRAAEATKRIDKAWRLRMVKSLDLDAELIAGWVRLEYDFAKPELQWHREILERHGVRRLNVAGRESRQR